METFSGSTSRQSVLLHLRSKLLFYHLFPCAYSGPSLIPFSPPPPHHIPTISRSPGPPFASSFLFPLVGLARRLLGGSVTSLVAAGRRKGITLSQENPGCLAARPPFLPPSTSLSHPSPSSLPSPHTSLPPSCPLPFRSCLICCPLPVSPSP